MHHGASVEQVRTTIDLPADVHAAATAIARDSGASLSEVVTRLVRSALGGAGPVRVTSSPVTGLRVVEVPVVVTSADVRSLEDEE